MAAKVWLVRMMLRISWTEKKSDEEVFREAGGTANNDKKPPSTATCFLGSCHEKVWSGNFDGDWKDRGNYSKGAPE